MSRPVRGFTLVELLVSMVILSLIMVGLLGALQGVGTTGARIDAHLEHTDDVQVAVGFLRQAFARLHLEPRFARGDDPAPGSLVAQESGLEWVGSMPARYGAGGLYRFRMTLVREGPEPGVRLQFVPFLAAQRVDWQAAQGHLLLPGAERMTLGFREAGAGAPWLAHWDYDDRLPELVSVGFSVAGRDWPAMIVRPATQSAPGSSAGSSAFTIGGGARP